MTIHTFMFEVREAHGPWLEGSTVFQFLPKFIYEPEGGRLLGWVTFGGMEWFSDDGGSPLSECFHRFEFAALALVLNRYPRRFAGAESDAIFEALDQGWKAGVAS